MSKKTKTQKKMMKLAKKLDKRREKDMKACATLLHSRLWLKERVREDDIAIPLPSYNEMVDAGMNQMLDDWGIQR